MARALFIACRCRLRRRRDHDFRAHLALQSRRRRKTSYRARPSPPTLACEHLHLLAKAGLYLVIKYQVLALTKLPTPPSQFSPSSWVQDQMRSEFLSQVFEQSPSPQESQLQMHPPLLSIVTCLACQIWTVMMRGGRQEGGDRRLEKERTDRPTDFSPLLSITEIFTCPRPLQL